MDVFSLSRDTHILNITSYTSNIHIFTCRLYFNKAWEKIKFYKRSNGDMTGTNFGTGLVRTAEDGGGEAALPWAAGGATEA